MIVGFAERCASPSILYLHVCVGASDALFCNYHRQEFLMVLPMLLLR